MLIKICGMRRQADLALADSLGVDFCGFIFASKSPRRIDPRLCAALETGAMKRVGVFVEQNPDEILAIMNSAKLDYIQLHGLFYEDIHKKIDPQKIIRVLWPQTYATIAELEQEAFNHKNSCAFFLLDSGNQGGGSGKALDFDHLKNLDLARPWFLAGGLNLENASKAANLANAAGLDFNSGLEDAPGEKNPQKVKFLMENLFREQNK